MELSANLLLRRLSISLVFLLGSVTLSGCSGVTNTIAGLTTPQSTISGSTYPYWVDRDSGQLIPDTPETSDTREFITPNDYFKVSLETGFLRYLQAVDPYVIVYSEAWVSSKPKPTDSDKMLRQIVLLKDGISQNARLPISSVTILGPMTYEKDTPDVIVALKVVVLSKRDNAQTISLIEGLAGAAGAAAPQYAVIAGAAASAMATFISQNRDKIEFEHTLVFSPNTSSGSGSNTKHANILKEGRIVV
ncbi:MAG: hypothetical protein KGS09_21015, partial [Nitrospirae bacterium]|nr:hypothetical protein [Nitrospirota bacterium]